MDRKDEIRLSSSELFCTHFVFIQVMLYRITYTFFRKQTGPATSPTDLN